MENTVHQEPELEKHEESMPEGTPLQSPEPSAEKKKEDQIDPLKKLQDELAEAKDKYVRLYAEFDNFRRRNAKEKLEMISSANEQLLKSLIQVMDDFERAEKVFKEKNDKESEGLLLIHNKFKKVLDQYNVKVMDVEKGSDFNTDLHEAITQIPAPEEKLKGKVVDVVEKGYLLNDKVIRFAKVVVGS
ncbi:MAG: nucleotide exchange factor GrpE [Bacteroidetes bacterium]|nr:nucleotide exchange factor GrpE [Bacteroidota bacterium]MBI3481989.1 nucleotide exchange factor GrpE [Bacteroidota bacterium]